jgi:hypothetical protein
VFGGASWGGDVEQDNESLAKSLATNLNATKQLAGQL